MPSTITSQTIIDGSRNTVMKYFLEGAATIGTAVFSGVGLDDLSSSGSYTDTVETTYLVEIDGTGTPDTFKWSDDNGASYTSGVNITGAAQALSNGVSITFLATTGHTLADVWTIPITINFTDEVLYDASASDSQNTKNRLDGIIYQLDGFAAHLDWDATSNVSIMTLDESLQEEVNMSSYKASTNPAFGGIPNNAGTGRTGDILITTTGMEVGDAGYIILTIKQRGA